MHIIIFMLKRVSLSSVLLSEAMLSSIMMIVICLNVVMVSVIMLFVVTPNVGAPENSMSVFIQENVANSLLWLKGGFHGMDLIPGRGLFYKTYFTLSFTLYKVTE
jgi:hypothetical protein